MRHLNQLELSRRWAVSPRTLERWRWTGTGPQYLKINGRVVYRLDDVVKFESERVYCRTRIGAGAEQAPRVKARDQR